MLKWFRSVRSGRVEVWDDGSAEYSEVAGAKYHHGRDSDLSDLFEDVTPSAGGGSQPTRNVGQVELDFVGLVVGSGATAAVPFTFGDGDPAMIDLADPEVPLPVTAGIYAYTLRVAAAGGSQGFIQLTADDDYYSIGATQYQAAVIPAVVSVTWFSTAGSAFHAAIHSDGGDTYSGNLYVQKIA